MTPQSLPLFAVIPAPPRPVDDIPRETRDPITGALLCRHHSLRIPASGAPCARCKTEGALDPGYGMRDPGDPYK